MQATYKGDEKFIKLGIEFSAEIYLIERDIDDKYLDIRNPTINGKHVPYLYDRVTERLLQNADARLTAEYNEYGN